jgi:hypothetical protein
MKGVILRKKKAGSISGFFFELALLPVDQHFSDHVVLAIFDHDRVNTRWCRPEIKGPFFLAVHFNIRDLADHDAKVVVNLDCECLLCRIGD